MHEIPGERVNGFQGNPSETHVLEQDLFDVNSSNSLFSDLIIRLFAVSVPSYERCFSFIYFLPPNNFIAKKQGLCTLALPFSPFVFTFGRGCHPDLSKCKH